MKKLLLILLCFTIIFSSCVNEVSINELNIKIKNEIEYYSDDIGLFSGIVVDSIIYENDKPALIKYRVEDGVKNGKYEAKFDGKVICLGFFKNGIGDGKWQHWYSNGQLSQEYYFKDGESDGLSKAWYENGQLLRYYNFQNGKKDGVCTDWHENGQIMVEETYNYGELKQLKEWTQSGILITNNSW